MQVLYLHVPGLLGPVPADARELLGDDPALDGLARLLSRGRSGGAGRGMDDPPGFRAAYGGALPAGPLSLLGDGGAPGAAFWFRADPVRLIPDRDRLRVQGLAPAAAPTADEAAALVRDFNAFFGADGLELHAPRPERWYLRCARPPQVTTTPLAEAEAADVDPALPTGPDQRHWRALLNETQMFFHGHGVNVEREGRGLPPVNGIWPWGGGYQPQVEADWDAVLADRALVRGLATAAGCRCEPLPDHPGSVIEGHARTLVCAPSPAVRDSDSFRDWEAALAAFAEGWGPTLEAALGSGRLRRVVIDTGAGGCYRLGRRSAWAVWRRRRPLRRLLVTA